MTKIAVLGYGTVGSGVVEVIQTNRDLINQKTGDSLEIKYILDLKEFPGSPIEKLIVHDFEEIVNDEEIKVVVEVMGGVEPAYTFVKRSLLAGKNVATSNKALVAKHGAELLAIAKEKNLNFLFEASVGGGIPIIRPLNTSLSADDIEEITGILNGTTNYMLSKMYHEDADYDAVLKEAQMMGYAERDPSADVDGHDACRKIAILSSIVSGKQVDFSDIYTEGITKITAQDMQYARQMDMVIKLLATMKRDGDKIEAIVAPFLLTAEHPLASVNGVFNAVFVHGNALGDAMFYGSGAGKMPTASAVTADIVEAARYKNQTLCDYWSEEKLELESRMDVKRTFFVRMAGEKCQYEELIRKTFGHVHYVESDICKGEFAFVTEVMKEGEYEAAASGFENVIHMIRIAS